ncbi:MAG: hypothetical protein AAGE98_07230 [Actinomycetota bacterium]
MTWLKRTLDELFSERSQLTAERYGRTDEAARQRAMEIEIEARREMRGF